MIAVRLISGEKVLDAGPGQINNILLISAQGSIAQKSIIRLLDRDALTANLGKGTVHIRYLRARGVDGGEIIAINPEGTEKWRKRIANYYVDSSPCIGEDGVVYIGSTYDQGRGYLHAFGSVESNEPPETPEIYGPARHEPGVEYEYTFVTTDPNGDGIYYYIDWSDGEIEDWIGPFESGEEVILTHTWTAMETLVIRAKAKDVFGDESDWAEFEIIWKSRSKATNTLFFKLLERFYWTFPALRNLLKM